MASILYLFSFFLLPIRALSSDVKFGNGLGEKALNNPVQTYFVYNCSGV